MKQTASIDIRTRSHVGRDFIDEDLLEHIKGNERTKHKKEEDLELYHHRFKCDSGYIIAIENKTDKKYLFKARITTGKNDYDDINDENNLAAIHTLCPPQKDSFVWL
jgi:hypothetical protein